MSMQTWNLLLQNKYLGIGLQMYVKYELTVSELSKALTYSIPDFILNC